MASTGRKALLERIDANELISVYVKDRKEPLRISKLLLTHASPWFNEALSKCRKEGQGRTIRLRETDLTTVTLFVHWMLKRCLDTSDWHLTAIDLIRAWIFGDKHLAPEFQNAVMKALHEGWRDEFDPSIEDYAEGWRRTKPGTLLFEFLAYAFHWDVKSYGVFEFESLNKCGLTEEPEITVALLGHFMDHTLDKRLPEIGSLMVKTDKQSED